MNKKPTFFTSDWYIGHENCLALDKRPFATIEEMHRSLVRRYNSIVPQSGICYFLGDMGNKTEDIRNVINKLNGTKVLLCGNHDKGISTMYNCGFDVVLLTASILVHKTIVTMSHCPLPGIKRQRYTTFNRGQFHLHGHIHSRKDKKTSVKILDKQYDVGVCANGYRPVSIGQIESWINR